MAATPFAVLAERCGLSQREAAEFLKVRLDTVKSWCAGRNVAKSSVLSELRGLYGMIEAAAERLAHHNKLLLEMQRKRGVPPGIVFGFAETDDVARAHGFPSQGPYMAAIGLALLRLPDNVAIQMEPQSYPGAGGGGAAPVVPGTELTWPQSRGAAMYKVRYKLGADLDSRTWPVGRFPDKETALAWFNSGDARKLALGQFKLDPDGTTPTDYYLVEGNEEQYFHLIKGK
ncbi:MAG TPA: hypothetical protein VEK73_16345 [Xanthobacteraceae bacterium]|nr:hypothetical protein [Xanthobacteraceae bacterium]